MNTVIIVIISILVGLGIFALVKFLYPDDDKPKSNVNPTSNAKPTSKVIPTSNAKPTSKVIPTSNVNHGFALNSLGAESDCLTIPTDPADSEIKLSSCDLSKKALQSFVYDESGYSISPVDYPNMCLGFKGLKTKGNEDPNMTLPLELLPCDSSYPGVMSQQFNWDGSSLSTIGGPAEVERGAMRTHVTSKGCVMAHGAKHIDGATKKGGVVVGNCIDKSDSSKFNKIPMDYFEAHINDPHP